MRRYKGRTSFKIIERDFPHIVEMLVPLGGFGKDLDAMYDWHRARGIEDRHERGRRVEGRDIVSWCFRHADTAGVFAAESATFTVKK
jgi:hypothetical protein